jgi:hypothetical protein
MQSKRGGSGRGQGRKPIKEGQDTVTVSLRLTVSQRDKLALLGGAEWVRQRIDKAKAPNVEFSGQAAASSPRSSAGTQG